MIFDWLLARGAAKDRNGFERWVALARFASWRM
jgi:hypothetical protein